MTESVGGVLYPTYAKLFQERPERLADSFRVIFLGSATVLIALAGAMSLSASGILRLLYGARWDAAIPVLSVLAWAGLLRGLARTIGPLLLAVRRPDVESKSKFAEAVVFVAAALYLAPSGGAAGVAWAGVLSYALAFGIRYATAISMFAGTRAVLVRDTVVLALLGGIAYTLAWELAPAGWLSRILLFMLLLTASALVCLGRLRAEVVKQAAHLVGSPPGTARVLR
jgi:O-antigen/teichoic acid export membrane protein